MNTRPFLALLASLFVTLPTVAGFAASSSSSSVCDDATARLYAELDASNNQMTPTVAHAFKDAVEACSSAGATSATMPPVPSSSAAPASANAKAWVSVDVRALPQTCGFTTTKTGHEDNAHLTAYRMVVLYTDGTNEAGPADVTYNPATDVASYTVNGPTYGMSIAGAAGVPKGASGNILVYGIPIPTTSATVNTGCDVNNPSLCWGFGYAETMLPNTAVGLIVMSAFNHC